MGDGFHRVGDGRIFRKGEKGTQVDIRECEQVERSSTGGVEGRGS